MPFAYRIDEDPKYEYHGYWKGAIPPPTVLGRQPRHRRRRLPSTSTPPSIDRVVDTWRDGLAELAADNMDRVGPGLSTDLDPAEVPIDALDTLTERGWRKAWDALDEPLSTLAYGIP